MNETRQKKVSNAVGKADSSELRICHLADIHLGYRRYHRLSKHGINQREMDVNLAFHEAVSRIIALKPQLTIIAGDLFHAVRPSNAVLTFCFRELKRLVQGTAAPVVLLAGNHETPKRADTGSLLRLFSEIEGIFVAESEPRAFRFKELALSVYCLPHPCLATLDARTVRADDNSRFNVLVVHAQVNENWVSDFGGVEVPLEALSPHEWDYIALGHVHVHRQVAMNACYSGSIEHTATNLWAEGATQKGFIEVSLPSGKRTFHALTSPREVLVLSPIEAQDLGPAELQGIIKERIDGVPGGIEGKIIRLEVLNVSRELQRALDHRELRRLRVGALNFSLEFRPPESTFALGGSRRAFTTSMQEELSEYCENSELAKEKVPQVLSLLEHYVQKLEAEHEATQS